MDASAAVRSAREEAFASLLAGIRAELAAFRGAASYPALFRSLLAESRAALPAARELRVDPRDLDLAMALAGELRVDPALDTWGGVELACDDGRTIRNTLEERLANAEPLLRRRFARRLATAVARGCAMRILGAADFGYGNARLRARRSDLLSDADYERLLGEDIDGLLGALEQTRYAPDLGADRRDGARPPARDDQPAPEPIAASRCAPSTPIGLASRRHDALALRRPQHRRRPASTVRRQAEGADALVRVGWMTGSLAQEILRQDELAASVDLLARSTPDRDQGPALRAAFAEYERTEDLAALERAVFADHAARLSASLASAGPAARTLLRFARREIDERNLLVALRLRDALASGAEANTPPAATRLPGGSVPLAALGRAERPDLGRRRRAPRAAGHGRWQTPLDTMGGKRGPLRAGARARAHAASRTRSPSSSPATRSRSTCRSPSWPRSRAEARNLRLLGEAAARGIDAADHPARTALDKGSAHEPPARPDDPRAGGRLPARGRRDRVRSRLVRGGCDATRGAPRPGGRRHRRPRSVLPRVRGPLRRRLDAASRPARGATTGGHDG